MAGVVVMLAAEALRADPPELSAVNNGRLMERHSQAFLDCKETRSTSIPGRAKEDENEMNARSTGPAQRKKAL
ncbi:hypothetical protein KIN20_002318 [Parelaphostrongylus tenuis]|uniref:Uncharacterized protein n=1 Tax=Parelaphostrongylus tenuis TaxID=148309 RepID=A0AAD5QCY2_PARTN|nr:hypothetical protein KIN20_002318 [Parelaphostrongylus tenuis]